MPAQPQVKGEEKTITDGEPLSRGSNPRQRNSLLFLKIHTPATNVACVVHPPLQLLSCFHICFLILRGPGEGGDSTLCLPVRRHHVDAHTHTHFISHNSRMGTLVGPLETL